MKFVTIFLISILFGFSCKPHAEDGASLKAIGTGDGKQAFSFIAVKEIKNDNNQKLRELYPNYFATPLFAIVNCSGNADSKIAKLESLSLMDNLRVDHFADSRKIELLTSNGQAAPGGCKIEGNFLMSWPVVYSWFLKFKGIDFAPKSFDRDMANFLNTQSLYLALRGSVKKSGSTKTNLLKIIEMANFHQEGNINGSETVDVSQFNNFFASYDPTRSR